MAKSGTPRHSKSARKPVTINLDASDVKRIDDDVAQTAKPIPPAEQVGDFSQKSESSKPAVSESSAAKTSEKPDTPAEKPPFTAGVKPESAEYRSATPKSSGSAPVPPKSPTPSKSSLSPLLAGLAGGVVALGGLLALQWANVIPSPGTRVTAQQLAHIEQEIANLRSSPTPAPLDDASKAQFAQLQKNVEAAEIKSEAVAGTLTDLQRQFEALPKAATNVDGAAVDELKQRLEAIEGKLSTAQNQADQATANVSGNADTISNLQTELASLQQRIMDTAKQPDASVMIAANALKSAVDRGGSFKAELETFAAVAPQEQSLQALQPFAQRGVPTVADLNAWFGNIANKIVASENKLPADASFWDHLTTSAKGLVSVRPVAGNVEGTGVGPITARMEAALQAGDLERAVSEWEQLPADAKAISKEFADQIKARRDADSLVQRLVTDSLKPKASADTPAPAGN